MVLNYKLLIIKLNFKLKNFILKIFDIIFFRKYYNPKTIGIWRIGNIGDIVTSINAFYSIKKKFHKSKIVLITSNGKGVEFANIIFENKMFDHVINYNINSLSDIFSLRKKINDQKFDLIIEIPEQLNSLSRKLKLIFFVRLMCNIKSMIFHNLDFTKMFKKELNQRFNFPNEETRIKNFLATLEIQYFTTPKKFMYDESYSFNSIPFKNYIVIAPGTKRKFTNSWPIEYFQEIINNLSVNHNIVILAGNDDKEIVHQILKNNTKKNVISLINKIPLINIFEFIANAKLFIGLDSGLQHIAAFEGTPMIVLVPSWNYYGTWFPHTTGKKIVLNKKDYVNCAPCFSLHCKNQMKCMNSILPNEVIQHAQKLLNS